jgi:hypothetical protein
MQGSPARKINDALAVTGPFVVVGDYSVNSGVDAIWSSAQHTADRRPAHCLLSTGLALARSSSVVRGPYPTDAGVSPSC